VRTQTYASELVNKRAQKREQEELV